MGVPLSAPYNVVNAPGVGVAVQTRQEFFFSDAAVDGGAGAGSGEGLVVGYPVFLGDFSPVVYRRLCDNAVGCGFGVWEGCGEGRWEWKCPTVGDFILHVCREGVVVIRRLVVLVF